MTFSTANKKSLGRKKKYPTYDDWIHSHQCWVSFAETCCVASDFLLAVDFFKKAIDCIEKINKKNPGRVNNKTCAKVWFSLAKCQMRSGEDEIAKNSLGRAVQVRHAWI